MNTALAYFEAGLIPLPLLPGEKRPAVRWKTWNPTRADLHFQDSQNIGILCGSPSGNLVALDCDSPASYQETMASLAALGIAAWTVQRPPNGSAHDGGGHCYVRTPFPMRSTKCQDIDVLAEGRYVVAPPSLHPQGGRYETVEGDFRRIPRIDPRDLPWLPLEPYQEKPPPSNPYAREDPQLTPNLVAMLQGQGEYPSRSEHDYHLVFKLILAGFDLDHIQDLFERYPTSGKYLEKARHGPAYLATTYNNALRAIANRPLDLQPIMAAVQTWPWTGRTGATDRAVLLAHLRIAHRCQKTEYAASTRELAELAGISNKTASNATSRLIDAGLLEPRETDDHDTNVFALPPTLLPATTTPLHPHPVLECVTKSPQNDAFRFQALNKTGLDVWQALPGSVIDIAQRTGRCRKTVSRKLKLMYQVGLAEPVGDGYWVRIDGDLDKAAEILGTKGKGEQQRKRHKQDRQNYEKVRQARQKRAH